MIEQPLERTDANELRHMLKRTVDRVDALADTIAMVKEKKPRNNVCYNCGKPGHIARFCGLPSARSTHYDNRPRDSYNQRRSPSKQNRQERRHDDYPRRDDFSRHDNYP